MSKKEKKELIEDYLTTDELNEIKQVIQDLNSAKIKFLDARSKNWRLVYIAIA